MGLKDNILQSMAQDTTALQKELGLELEKTDISYAKQLSTLQREYETDVENQIHNRVNLELFLQKKHSLFDTAHTQQQIIDQLFLDLMPQILASKRLHKELINFLDTIQISSSNHSIITIQGVFAKDLDHKIQAITKLKTIIDPSDKILGIVRFEDDKKVYEFSLEELIAQLKVETLTKIMTLFE